MRLTQAPWRLGAGELAGAIATGSVSSEAVVRAHLDRIAAVNPAVNAVTATLAEPALRAARAADRAIAAGRPVGPLHGVPVTVKANIDVAGSATGFGVAAAQDFMPEADAPVIAHLRRAGAIVIARTNLPDYGLRWHTDNARYGPTRNPWDPARTPGGSSGGEAAAIATGMSPLGIGNDMGGSIRVPAAFCGIAGLRPGLGRVSRLATRAFADPPLFYEQVASVNGPMARQIGDLRLALAVMAGPDPADPLWQPAPAIPAAPPPGVAMAGVAMAGVAMVVDPLGDGVDDRVAAAIRRAAAVLNDAGHAVAERAPPAITDAARTLVAIVNPEILSYLPVLRKLVSADANRFLADLLADTRADPAGYAAAIAERHRIAGEWRLFMQTTPLILGPVCTRQAFAVGADLAGPAALRRIEASIALTEIANLLGLPALSVPVRLDDGLPQAVQLIGPRFGEALCLDAGEVIERALGVPTPIDPFPARPASLDCA